MSKLSRRDFIKKSLIATASAGIAASVQTRAWSQVIGANDDIRLAVVGFRDKGENHISGFREIAGVRVAALCDVDKEVLGREVKKFEERNEKVDAYTDVRKLLEDKNIDAIVTATPNHWHSLITVWACQAGKDVYVEKPVSHEIWEGRKMIEAARKYERIVQAGTQKRTCEGLKAALEYIRQENLGKIVVARGLCYKRRKSIGKVAGPQPIPESVDYDLWTGPAPLSPLMREKLHYDWHWVWDTGNGDIGNQGVHEMDMCRWALGEKGLARRVTSIGGRFGYDDDGQTANTQITILEYESAPIIFEVRGLPRRKDGAAMDDYRDIRIGVVIECEHGYFAGGGGGGWVYDDKGNKVQQFTGRGGEGHRENFIEAMRSRKKSDLNADILEGHLSSALCHMGNISYRLGQRSSPEEIKEAIKEDKNAIETFGRFQEHLFGNWIDLSRVPAVLGPCLEMDSKKEEFVDSGNGGAKKLTLFANQMLKRDYRRPFVVPEDV
jgi:predicted dehydrogenase